MFLTHLTCNRLSIKALEAVRYKLHPDNFLYFIMTGDMECVCLGSQGVGGDKFQTFLHTVNAGDMSDEFMTSSEQRP